MLGRESLVLCAVLLEAVVLRGLVRFAGGSGGLATLGSLDVRVGTVTEVSSASQKLLLRARRLRSKKMVNDGNLRSAEAVLAGHPLVGGSVLLKAIVLLSAGFSARSGATSEKNGVNWVGNEEKRGE